MQAEDAELIERYLKGEKKAVETVHGWIVRAACPYKRRLGTHWDDVLQDIQMELFRLLREGKFRGESSLRTYIWRVASHTCMDRIRAERPVKWIGLNGVDDIEDPSVLATVLSHDGPGKSLEVKDLLLRVLVRVPAECRALWRMVHAGLSYREMSERWGVAEGTLRVRVLRCREKAMERRREIAP